MYVALTIQGWTRYCKFLWDFIHRYDCHKWVICHEVGENGYKHTHVGFSLSDGALGPKERVFEFFRVYTPMAHVEFIEKEKRYNKYHEYCKKDGFFICSEDTPEIFAVRQGQMRDYQKAMVEMVSSQNVRQIDVWVDPKGNHGKSWLCNHLVERRKAFWCPPYMGSVKDLSQWIASGYNGEGMIIIDIPRSWKWTEDIYAGIEAIKDGLVFDTRYEHHVRNIRGVKLLILCNKAPNEKELSYDRWRTWYFVDGLKTFTNKETLKEYLNREEQ